MQIKGNNLPPSYEPDAHDLILRQISVHLLDLPREEAQEILIEELSPLFKSRPLPECQERLEVIRVISLQKTKGARRCLVGHRKKKRKASS